MHDSPVIAEPETFIGFWDRAVAEHSERPFLLFREEDGQVTAWTYSEFDRVVDRAAAALASRGVSVGASVHMCLRNSPGFVALWLASARLGAWIVPADPAASAKDIARQLERTRPSVGVTSTRHATVYRSGVAGTGLPVVELTETAADVQDGGVLDVGTREVRRHALSPRDRLAIMFTSGTTSEPKGVELTQANYATVAATMASVAALEPRHRWYVTLPLFHANAQYYCFASAIAVGASVGLAATFSASGWVEGARSLEVTHASLFAAPMRMILARTPEGTQPLALEHCWFAQNLAPEQYRRFSDLIGVTPRQIYGMTETVAVVTCDLTDDPGPGSIGAVTPGRRAALLHHDSLEPVGRGEPGMICVAGTRGADLFRGYLDAPETTRRSFGTDAAGTTWFMTGDLATEDENGRWHFMGRVDDVVKVAGENVSLTEIEASVAHAPGVLEAAVVAVPDPIRDVVPIAFVVPIDHSAPPKEEELSAWAETHLTPAARPRQWRLIDALPRTSVGKIRRSAITI